MAKTILVTGSSGLIGSEVCVYFAAQGYTVHGVDNNQRETFFGPQGNTRWNQKRLAEKRGAFFTPSRPKRSTHLHSDSKANRESHSIRTVNTHYE